MSTPTESVQIDRLLKRLGFGAQFWNLRRQEDPDTPIALDGAKLDRLILTDVDFSNASLRGASMHATNLMNADLRGADLSGANLVEADLIGANLEGARLDGATCCQADFRGARLTNASYSPADLEGALNVPEGTPSRRSGRVEVK